MITDDLRGDGRFAGLLRAAKLEPREPIHSFHRYFGKLIPAIPRAFIRELTQPGDIVLDPFCGSGTTLVEARLLGRRAVGVDLNPLSVLITRAKLTNLRPARLTKHLEQILTTARKQLLAEKATPPLPFCPNRDHWFRPDVARDLAFLLAAIDGFATGEAAGEQAERDFFRAVFSGVLRDVSNADPRHVFPGYSKRLRALDAAGARPIDALARFESGAKKRIAAVAAFQGKLQTPETQDGADWVEVHCADATSLSRSGDGVLKKGSVRLVVTNPPYISSIRYLETMKLELYWLGLAKSHEDYLNLDRRGCGTERFYRGEYSRWHETGIDSVDEVTKRLSAAGHAKMSLVVARYFEAMKAFFGEMANLIAPGGGEGRDARGGASHSPRRTGGHLVIKISDSFVRGETVPTHAIFVELAMQHGFAPVEVFPDDIKSRSLLTKRNSYSGMIQNDWILVFRREGQDENGGE